MAQNDNQKKKNITFYWKHFCKEKKNKKFANYNKQTNKSVNGSDSLEWRINNKRVIN